MKKQPNLWRKLATKLLRQSTPITQRQFRSLFGVTVAVTNKIFSFLSNWSEVSLLLTLFFLKTYPTATPGAVMFDINEKEFAEEVAWTLDELREKLPKISWKDRLLDEPANIWNVNARSVVDTTSCNIPVPKGKNMKLIRKLFYSRKKRSQIKYEIAVGVRSGRIVWLKGPFPGSYSDPKIVQHSGLLSKIPRNEAIFADGIYNTKDLKAHNFFTPLRHLSRTQRLFYTKLELKTRRHLNRTIRGQRVIVERTLARIKSFSSLSNSTIWRHSYEQHRKTFDVICRIVNIDLKYHPL